ncbi:Spiroplasmavirus-related protein [Spiroplasma kunkelii CR2-3x]|uniref:Spiroplasmavirus-related protein n=1 Tax=Spiroplasma kunkelii CR2-3x TaxID=273035 RepID=A0A0K2JFI3_SPIKU|nr:lipoprotein [Spiroplasma kunkelii]ALA97335.1 Spiroplasmavirus-related protein [Spiroplasma kunkelii CR2-3x]
MKKWLSIIGVIGLTATSTTTLISCEKPNNNENGRRNNKPELPDNQQQPPKDSNWKLIENNNRESEFSKPNNKWYFYIRITDIQIIDKYICEKVYFDSNFIKNHYTYWQHLKYGINFPVYRWDSVGEPQLPTINKNTGEIIDWK